MYSSPDRMAPSSPETFLNVANSLGAAESGSACKRAISSSGAQARAADVRPVSAMEERARAVNDPLRLIVRVAVR